MTRPKKRPPPKESREDTYIRQLYRAAGCRVISFSQPRQTKQTPGIPDLLIFCERTGDWWWHEVKRQQGPEFLAIQHGQTEAQQAFHALVESFGHVYLIGARDVAIAKLREIGLIEEAP